MSADHVWQQCIAPDCAKTYAVDEIVHRCTACGRLLDVVYDWSKRSLPSRAADLGADPTPGPDPR